MKTTSKRKLKASSGDVVRVLEVPNACGTAGEELDIFDWVYLTPDGKLKKWTKGCNQTIVGQVAGIVDE